MPPILLLPQLSMLALFAINYGVLGARNCELVSLAGFPPNRPVALAHKPAPSKSHEGKGSAVTRLPPLWKGRKIQTDPLSRVSLGS